MPAKFLLSIMKKLNATELIDGSFIVDNIRQIKNEKEECILKPGMSSVAFNFFIIGNKNLAGILYLYQLQCFLSLHLLPYLNNNQYHQSRLFQLLQLE